MRSRRRQSPLPMLGDLVRSLAPLSYWRMDEPGYAELVRRLAPRAHWRLNEATPGTGTAVDAMGAYSGAYVASPTGGVTGALLGDVADTAVTFNGTTQYAGSIPAAVLPTTAGTISAWVKRAGTLRNETVFGGSQADTGAAALGFHSAADNYIRLTKINTASLFRSSAAIADTNWHHVVATWDGTAAGRHMYIDGVEGTVVGAPVDCAAATASAAIGAYSNATAFFSGSIDEVAVWDRSLSPGEVSALYRAGVLTGQFRDSAGSNHATPTAVTAASLGAPGLVAGSAGAANFAGTQYGSTPSTTDTRLLLNGNFTIAAWLLWTGPASGFPSIMRTSASANQKSFYIDGASGLIMLNDPTQGPSTPTFKAVSGVPVFVVMTYDGVVMSRYKDGQFINSYARTPAVDGGGSTGRIGSSFIGRISDIAYWERALSPDEIAALYAAGRG